MMALDEPLDFTECGSARSVYRDFCEVCDAEFGELCGEGSDARPVMPVGRPWLETRMLHPSLPVRFTDVVNELKEIADLASAAAEVEGSKLAAACRRAESLLRVLRAQFMQEVVLDGDRRPSQHI